MAISRIWLIENTQEKQLWQGIPALTNSFLYKIPGVTQTHEVFTGSSNTAGKRGKLSHLLQQALIPWQLLPVAK